MPLFLLKYWKYIAVAVIAAIVLRGVYVAGGEAPRAELRRVQEMQALQAAHDLKNKERTDEEIRRRSAAVGRELAGLRERSQERPLVGPPRPGDSGTASYDRAELDRALQVFEREVEGIVGEGQKALDALDAMR